MLRDVQKLPDERGIEIDQVGVSNVKYPLTLPLREGGTFSTVADVSMTVCLPHSQKGTHMSRFMIALNERNHHFHPETVHLVLEELLERLEAEEAFVDLTFPIFLERAAPVTGERGLLNYHCHLRAMHTADGQHDKVIGVVANVASLCPCSKEISERGAHNQRSEVKMDIRPTDDTFVWFEELIDIAERNGSSALYPILKRPDEKHVTETAYDNPKFVEDIVRDVSGDLQEMLVMHRIQWFNVQINNFESIHNHDAFAKVERGERGPVMQPHRAQEAGNPVP